MSHCASEALEHQDGQRQEMQAGQGLRQAFVIACQTPETGRPGETPFDDPPPRQEHKAFLGLRQPDDFQAQTVGGCGLLRLLTRVALIDVRQLHRLTSYLLDLVGQHFQLSAVLHIRRGDAQGQQLPQGIDGLMDFSAPLASAVSKGFFNDRTVGEKAVNAVVAKWGPFRALVYCFWDWKGQGQSPMEAWASLGI